MSIAHIRKYATGPRKEKKPAISVTVVINTDEPIAGSKFNLSKLISIKAPKRPVIINFMIMAVVRAAVICTPKLQPTKNTHNKSKSHSAEETYGCFLNNKLTRVASC